MMRPVPVRAYHNIGADLEGRPTGFLDGFAPGDPVVWVFAAELDGERFGSDLAACEEVYKLLNVGDDPDIMGGRPDPRAVAYRQAGNRSLSIGDLVSVAGRFYACASVGFTRLTVDPVVCVQTRYGTTPLATVEAQT